MLKIRLQRAGRKREYSYRLVVAEHTAPVKGRFVEKLGYYKPTENSKALSVNQDRIDYWISVGAKPSETVARLLAKEGKKEMEKYFRVHEHKRAPKKAPEESEEKTEEKQEDKKEEAKS